jgi:hypothetical protein
VAEGFEAVEADVGAYNGYEDPDKEDGSDVDGFSRQDVGVAHGTDEGILEDRGDGRGQEEGILEIGKDFKERPDPGNALDTLRGAVSNWLSERVMGIP